AAVSFPQSLTPSSDGLTPHCVSASPFPRRGAAWIQSNLGRRRNRLRHQRQVIGLHWWGMLQLANARLRARLFSAFQGASELRQALPDGRGSDWTHSHWARRVSIPRPMLESNQRAHASLPRTV